MWLPALIDQRAVFSGAVAAAPAYVTGDRTASITITSSGFTFDGGTVSNWVDGGFGANVTDSLSWLGTSVAGNWVRFDFGTAKLVTEAKWYQDSNAPHGIWKWQGSNDATSWTDIGTTFTLGGATPQTQTELNGNAISYRYYRLLGSSGVTSNAPWLEEIEFKQT